MKTIVSKLLYELDVLCKLHDQLKVKKKSLRIQFNGMTFFERNDVKISQTRTQIEINKVQRMIANKVNELNVQLSQEQLVYDAV